MSAQRFDDLTKSLAARTTSRRSLLKSALVAAAAGTTYGLTAPARAHHEGGERCRDTGDLCRSNADCCSRYCDSITSQCACPPALPDCTAHGDCRDIGENCRANADCCLGLCVTETFECACPPQLPNCNAHGNCRDAGANCRSSAECCSGFCDTTGHCAQCPPGTELCRGNCIAACDQCQECSQLTGRCEPKRNDTPCDDRNPCTVGDTCQNGLCMSGPLRSCDDGNPCTTDACDPSTGMCTNTTIQGCRRCTTASECPKPSDQCQQATCIGGVCGVAPRTGSTCNDNNPCTRSDTCQSSGICIGTPLVCTPGTVCCMGAGVPTSNAGKCLRPTGAMCAGKADCCSNNCMAGRCA